MTRKFVALKAFTDLEDGRHVYKAGHIYPREGVELDEERAESLLTTDNKRKEALIVQIAVNEEPEPDLEAEEADGVPKEFPASLGGGHYELSNGEKVQGKEKAIEAEKALKE